MKILLVEDEEALRSITKTLLEIHGHTCIDCRNGLIATETLTRDTNFDLLITDLKMPVMTGAQLLEWCRKNDFHFPVIFTSGTTELLNTEKIALSDCCAQILEKPFGFNDLLAGLEIARDKMHAFDCSKRCDLPIT